jgi:hypothetical protein
MKTADGTTRTVLLRNGDTVANVSVTGSWQRFEVLGASPNARFLIGLRGGTGTSATADLVVYGAQVESGSSSTAYDQYPFGNTLDTNVNFAITDYAETGASGGLKGDGSAKHLDTGLNLSAIGASTSDGHLLVYTAGTEAVGTTRVSLGAFSGANEAYIGWTNGGSNETAVLGGGTTVDRRLLSSSGVQGSLAIAVGAGRVMQGYVNGSTAGTTQVASGAYPALNLFVGAANSNGSAVQWSLARRFRAYSIGLSMNSAQMAAYHAALQAFQTALGRNV